MKQDTLCDSIRELTSRALWEVENVIACIPEYLWQKVYSEAPLWQHVYHMLHSLDLWFINPGDVSFVEPAFHTPELNNLDVPPETELTRQQMDGYYAGIKAKIQRYVGGLQDDMLLQKPPGSEYTTFTLMLAQFRHLHSHMGMLMGFIIEDTGCWPRVLGLLSPFPDDPFDRFY